MKHFPKVLFFLGVLLLLFVGVMSILSRHAAPAPHPLRSQAQLSPSNPEESAPGSFAKMGSQPPEPRSPSRQGTNPSSQAPLQQRDGAAPLTPAPASQRGGAVPPTAVSAIGFSEIMRGIITVALMAASLFVILAKRYSPDDKRWAYATIGTILGFWLPK